MKTLNEIYTEVMANEELKAKFAAVKDIDELAAAVKELGCDAAKDEIVTFFQEKSTNAGELSDAELNQVAGGLDLEKIEIKTSSVSLFTTINFCQPTYSFTKDFKYACASEDLR